MSEHEAVDRGEAVSRLLGIRRGLLARAGTERATPGELAGRTVAAAVTAPADVPAHDVATMDGFAFAARDGYPLAVTGRVGPADEPTDLGPGEAVRVATGAPLPARADAVLRREDAEVADGDLTGPAIDPGTNRYPAGSTAAAGERLLGTGERLAPRHAALLADAGVESVTVHDRLSVGVLATGTEICEGRQPDRDSGFLVDLVRRWGHDPVRLEPVPDDESAVRVAIERAAADHDVVLTSGGTSVGRADHVVGVLRDHDLRFRSVALRPGRPVAAARVADSLVLALPGKPVAAHTAATLVGRPLFVGEESLPTVAATLACEVEIPDADYEYAIPVALDGDRATPVGHADSPLDLYGTRFAPGRVASSTRVTLADGLVLARTSLAADATVSVVPYEVVE